MRTISPKKKLGFDTTQIDESTKDRQLTINQNNSNSNVFHNIMNSLTAYFDNLRFTFGDAARLWLLFITTLFLTTNIDQSYHPRIEASLLGAQAIEVIPEISYTTVINPIPTFVKELHLYQDTADEMPVEDVVVAEETDKQINLQSLQPTNYSDQAKVTITSNNRILVEERKTTVASKTDHKIVSPIYTTSVSSSVSHQATAKQVISQSVYRHEQAQATNEIYYTTVDKTRNRAVREGKSSFVLFGAPWCSPCRMMKDVLRTNEPIRNHIANNFLYDHVDIESGEGKLLKLEYNVSVVPTFILFDANGNQVKKYEGAMNSQRIMEVLGIADPSSNHRIVSRSNPTVQAKLVSNPEQRKTQLNSIIADVKENYIVDKKSDK